MTANKNPAVVTKSTSRYELWQNTIDGAITDSRWAEYDCDIQRSVIQCNRHLSNTSDFRPLNWRLIKAMVSTESGGPDGRAWRNNPMQIGNPGDPGLRALLSDKEGSDLIIPPDLKKKRTIASAGSSPQMNIQAGTAYLLMRLAKYGVATVADKDDKSLHEVVVRMGDSLDRLARVNGTTVDILKRLNAGTGPLRSGQIIKYQRGSVERVITKWCVIDSLSIANRYNIGDPAYARKLGYCLTVMSRLKPGRPHASPDSFFSCNNPGASGGGAAFRCGVDGSLRR